MTASVWWMRQLILLLRGLALFRKDCELPNSRIWLADIDIERRLHFPSRRVMFCSEKVGNKNEIQKFWVFSSNNIYSWKCQKNLTRKKRKKNEQTLAETQLIVVHKAKCQLVETSYIKRIKLFLFAPCNKQLISRA